jgi:hypothetical protein
MSVSMVSPTIVTWSIGPRASNSCSAMRMITGLGLPTLNAFIPEADSSSATIAPAARGAALLGRAVGIQVGGHQLGAGGEKRSAFSAISKFSTRPSPTTT